MTNFWRFLSTVVPLVPLFCMTSCVTGRTLEFHKLCGPRGPSLLGDNLENLNFWKFLSTVVHQVPLLGMTSCETAGLWNFITCGPSGPSLLRDKLENEKLLRFLSTVVPLVPLFCMTSCLTGRTLEFLKFCGPSSPSLF